MSTPAHRKREALQFWDRHGLQATLEAFAVSRSTVYAWHKRYREGGEAALHARPRVPHRWRTRQWPPVVVREIRRLRSVHPRLGAS